MGGEDDGPEKSAEYLLADEKIKQLQDLVFAKPSKEDMISSKAKSCLDCFNCVCKWIESKPHVKLFQEVLVELYDVSATFLLSGDWYSALIKGNGKLMGVMDTELRSFFNVIMSEALDKGLLSERKRFNELMPMIEKNPWSISYIQDLILSGGDIAKALKAVKELLQSENELMIRIRLGIMFLGRMFKEAAQIADYIYGISENLCAIQDIAPFYDENFFSDIVLMYYTAISVVEKRKYDRDVKNEANSRTADTVGSSTVKPPRTRKKISLSLVCETLDRLMNKKFCQTRIVSCWTGWSEAFATVTTVLVNTVLVDRKFLSTDYLKNLFQYWINCFETTSKNRFAPWNIFIRTEKIPSAYIYALADVVISNIQVDKTFVVKATEMYVHALNCDINDMDHLYVDANHSKQDEEWKSRRRKLADRYCKFAEILRENKRLMKDAVITAFSLCPTEELLERIFSDDLKLTSEEEQVPVESIKLVYEGEAYELQKELKYDLNSVLENPREKHFSWIKTEEEFKKACQDYLKKGGKKILKKEDLKHLVVDFNEYKPANPNLWAEESWIEKGYELKGKPRYRFKPRGHTALTKKGNAPTVKSGARKPKKVPLSKTKFAKSKALVLNKKPEIRAKMSAATKSRNNAQQKLKKIPQRVIAKFHPRRLIPTLSSLTNRKARKRSKFEDIEDYEYDDGDEEIPSLELQCIGMEKFIPRPCATKPTDETGEASRIIKPTDAAFKDLFFRITSAEAYHHLDRNHINVLGSDDFNAKYLKESSNFSMSTISNAIREDLTTPADASSSLFSKTISDFKEKVKKAIEEEDLKIPMINRVSSKPIVELERNIPDTLVDNIAQSIALDVLINVVRNAMNQYLEACANPSSSPTLMAALGLDEKDIPNLMDPKTFIHLIPKIIEEQVHKDMPVLTPEYSSSINRPINHFRAANQPMLKKQPGPKRITDRRYAKAIVEKTAATVRQNLLIKQKSLALGFAQGNLISATLLPHITVPEYCNNTKHAKLSDSTSCNMIADAITSCTGGQSSGEKSSLNCEPGSLGKPCGIRFVHFAPDFSAIEGLLAQHCLTKLPSPLPDSNMVRLSGTSVNPKEEYPKSSEPGEDFAKLFSERTPMKDSTPPTFNTVLGIARLVYGIPSSDGVEDDEGDRICKLQQDMEDELATLLPRKKPVVMLEKLTVQKLKSKAKIDPNTGKPKRGRPKKQPAVPRESFKNNQNLKAPLKVATNVPDHKISPVDKRTPQSQTCVRSSSLLKQRKGPEGTGIYEPYPKPIIILPQPARSSISPSSKLHASPSSVVENVESEKIITALNSTLAFNSSDLNPFSISEYVAKELHGLLHTRDSQVWHPQQVDDERNTGLIHPQMLASCAAPTSNSSMSTYGPIEVGRSARADHPGENVGYEFRPKVSANDLRIDNTQTNDEESIAMELSVEDLVNFQDPSLVLSENALEEPLSSPSIEDIGTLQMITPQDSQPNEIKSLAYNLQSVDSNDTIASEHIAAVIPETIDQACLTLVGSSQENQNNKHDSHSSLLDAAQSSCAGNVPLVYLNDATGKFQHSTDSNLKFEDATKTVENPIVFEENHASTDSDDGPVGNEIFFGPECLTENEDEDSGKQRKLSESSGSSYLPGDDEVELTETSTEVSSDADLFNPQNRKNPMVKASVKRTKKKANSSAAPSWQSRQDVFTPHERQRMSTCKVMLKRSSLHLGSTTCKHVEEIIVSSSSGSQNEDSGMDSCSKNVQKQKRRPKSRLDEHRNSDNVSHVTVKVDPQDQPGPSRCSKLLRGRPSGSRKRHAVKRGKPYGPKSKRKIFSSEENSPAPDVVVISDSEPETVVEISKNPSASASMCTNDFNHSPESESAIDNHIEEIMDLNLPEEDAEEEVDPFLEDVRPSTINVDPEQTASPHEVCRTSVQQLSNNSAILPTDRIQLDDVPDQQFDNDKECSLMGELKDLGSFIKESTVDDGCLNETAEGNALSTTLTCSLALSSVTESNLRSAPPNELSAEDPPPEESTSDGSLLDEDQSSVGTTDVDDEDLGYEIDKTREITERETEAIHVDVVEEVNPDEELNRISPLLVHPEEVNHWSTPKLVEESTDKVSRVISPILVPESNEEALLSKCLEVESEVQNDRIRPIQDTISDDINNSGQTLEECLEKNGENFEKKDRVEEVQLQKKAEKRGELIELREDSQDELSVDLNESEDIVEIGNTTPLSPNVLCIRSESSYGIASLAAPSPLYLETEDDDPLDISDMTRGDTYEKLEASSDQPLDNMISVPTENLSVVTMRCSRPGVVNSKPEPSVSAPVEITESECGELVENSCKDPLSITGLSDPTDILVHSEEIEDEPVRFLPLPLCAPARKISQSSESSDEVTVLEVRASPIKPRTLAARAGSSRRKFSQPVKSLARISPKPDSGKPTNIVRPKSHDLQRSTRSYRLRERTSLSTPAKFKGYEVEKKKQGRKNRQEVNTFQSEGDCDSRHSGGDSVSSVETKPSVASKRTPEMPVQDTAPPKKFFILKKISSDVSGSKVKTQHYDIDVEELEMDTVDVPSVGIENPWISSAEPELLEHSMPSLRPQENGAVLTPQMVGISAECQVEVSHHPPASIESRKTETLDESMQVEIQPGLIKLVSRECPLSRIASSPEFDCQSLAIESLSVEVESQGRETYALEQEGDVIEIVDSENEHGCVDFIRDHDYVTSMQDEVFAGSAAEGDLHVVDISARRETEQDANVDCGDEVQSFMDGGFVNLEEMPLHYDAISDAPTIPSLAEALIKEPSRIKSPDITVGYRRSSTSSRSSHSAKKTRQHSSKDSPTIRTYSRSKEHTLPPVLQEADEVLVEDCDEIDCSPPVLERFDRDANGQ